MPSELWPPLGVIQAALSGAADGDAAAVASPPLEHATADLPPSSPAAIDAAFPLHDLLCRRRAVAAQGFDSQWAPGRLLALSCEGRMFGVLLDRCIGAHRWRGWMAASEADWAGPFDVLLEPEDEPFEPLFGVVQTWNPLTLVRSSDVEARVIGALSAQRLAAIRSVDAESTAHAPLAIASAPGHIALRTSRDSVSVLTGTPLAADDPRVAYQDLYREAASRLCVALDRTTPATAPLHRRAAVTPPAPSGWARLRRWLAADLFLRPAFAMLALVVVVQNLNSWPQRTQDDEVRFRAVAPAPLAPAELMLRWQPEATVADITLLLQAASATVVAGPDAQGRWRVRVVDLQAARSALQAAPEIVAVLPEAATP